MKDLEHETEVQRLLQTWQSSDPARLAQILHPDFCAFGCEEGLYVRSDGPTFLRFLAHMRPERNASTSVEWIDIRRGVASACVVQADPQSRRTSFLTLIGTEAGWRVISATFEAENGPPRASRQGLPQ